MGKAESGNIKQDQVEINRTAGESAPPALWSEAAMEHSNDRIKKMQDAKGELSTEFAKTIIADTKTVFPNPQNAEQRLKNMVPADSLALNQVGLKDSGAFLKDMAQTAQTLADATASERPGVFRDAVARFKKENPDADPFVFGKNLNDALRGSSMRVRNTPPYVELKDSAEMSRTNPSGLVSEQFIGKRREQSSN